MKNKNGNIAVSLISGMVCTVVFVTAIRGSIKSDRRFFGSRSGVEEADILSEKLEKLIDLPANDPGLVDLGTATHTDASFEWKVKDIYNGSLKTRLKEITVKKRNLGNRVLVGVKYSDY